jgi:hypothetical protein
MRKVLAAVLLLGASQAPAASTPDEFAYGFRIEVAADVPVHELVLPAEVYGGVTRADLGDLRVFNAAGEAVPHLLRAAPAAAAEPRFAALPIFPVFVAAGRAGAGLSIETETRADGAIVRVRRADAGGGELAGYLLDASAIDQPLTALALQLEENGADVVARVTVEASHDLTTWRAVAPARAVARVAYGEHRLEQTTVPLPDVRAPYLRLAWAADEAGGGARPVLSGVAAQLGTPEREPEREWRSLAGVAAAARERRYEYETGGHFPVDRIGFELPANSLLSVVVSSRPSADAAWRERHRGTHYHLRVGGVELRGEPATLPRTSDRYWRVEVRDGSYANAAPALRVGWTPQRLAFLAAGEPPYLLAYGSGSARPVAAPLDGVLATLGARGGATLLQQARLGEAVELGGAERLRPAPTSVDWRHWTLWGVLLAGVAILAAMAWRLRREMAPQ